MGFEKLSFENRAALIGIASMVLGESEGTKGGAGHIGLLNIDGKERIVTFDTHGGASGGNDAITSGNRLRDKLLAIARDAGLDADAIRQIRHQLGLGEDENSVRFASLLERKIVASVVTMIGGNDVWSAAKGGHYGPAFKSPKGNTFSTVMSGLQGRNPISLINSENIPGSADLSALKDKAKALIAKFDDYVNNGAGATGKHYVKLNGKGELVDAGPRNIFRGEGARRENDFVRTRLFNAILLLYEGRIPADVKAQMTNFTQGGHPLSTSRIRSILQAMSANAPVDDNTGALVSLRQRKLRLCRLTNRLTDKVCQLLENGNSKQKEALQKWLGTSSPTHSQIHRKLREALTTDKMPLLAFLGKRFVMKDQEGLQSAVKAYLRDSNEAELKQGNNGTGFYHDLLRVMSNSSMLKMRTVDGKPVPPGISPVKGFGIEDTTGIKPGDKPVVRYNDKTKLGQHDVSAATFEFFHQLEEKVPDKNLRHFLTLTMGISSSLDDALTMNPEQCHLLGYTEEYVRVLSRPTELQCSQLVDLGLDSRKVDISFRDNDRTAVITERVNVSPVIGNIVNCSLKDEAIALTDNWYEITTTVDLTQDMTDRVTPAFTQSIRHLGELPTHELASEDIAPDLFASEKAALDVFDSFVAFSDGQGGRGDAYVKVLRGVDFDRGEVQLGPTQGEEKPGGRGLAEKEVNNKARKMLYASVERIFGGRVPDEVRRVMTNDVYDGSPLSASHIDKIRQAVVSAYLKKPTAELVNDPLSIRILSAYGSSQMTSDPTLKKKLVDLHVPYLGEVPEFWDFMSQKSQDTLRRFTDEKMKQEMSSNVPKMMKEFVSGGLIEGNTWGRDVGRVQFVCLGKDCTYRKSLKGVGQQELTHKEECEYVQNMMAAAWTGDEGMTFDKLDEKNRKIVRFMQCNLNQSIEGCAEHGAYFIISARSQQSLQETHFVEKTDSGGLRFSVRSYITMEKVSVDMADPGPMESAPLDRKTSFKAREVVVEFSAEDIEKICNADWNKVKDLVADAEGRMKGGMSEYEAYQAAYQNGYQEFDLHPKVETMSAFRFEVKG